MSIAQRYRALADSDAGFSLVEVIVAFVIFGIVASAATIAIFTGTTVSQASRTRVNAANVAQQQLAVAQALAPSSLASWNPSSAGTSSLTLAGQVAYTPANTPCTGPTVVDTTTGPHFATVTVTVTPTGRGQAVSMTTVIAC